MLRNNKIGIDFDKLFYISFLILSDHINFFYVLSYLFTTYIACVNVLLNDMGNVTFFLHTFEVKYVLTIMLLDLWKTIDTLLYKYM